MYLRALHSGTLLCRWLLHKHLWNLMATLEIWPFLDVGESQDLGWVFCTWLYLHEAIFLYALLSGGMVAEIFCYSCKHTHLSFASDLTWQSLPPDPSLKRHLASQAESQLYPNMLLTSSIQCDPLDHIHADVPIRREIPRQKTKHLLLYEFVFSVFIYKPSKAPHQGIYIQRRNTSVAEISAWDWWGGITESASAH